MWTRWPPKAAPPGHYIWENTANRLANNIGTMLHHSGERRRYPGNFRGTRPTLEAGQAFFSWAVKGLPCRIWQWAKWPERGGAISFRQRLQGPLSVSGRASELGTRGSTW